MINYETRIRNNNFKSLDRSKKNISIIGDCGSNVKQKIILNPMTIANAKKIYGKTPLYDAYKFAKEITNDDNFYKVCK